MTLTDGSAGFSAARTSVVTSIALSFASVASFAMRCWRRGGASDLLDDLDQPRADLLLDVGLRCDWSWRCEF